MACEHEASRSDRAFRDLVVWILAQERTHGSAGAVLNGTTFILTITRHNAGCYVKLDPQVELVALGAVAAYLHVEGHDVRFRAAVGPVFAADTLIKSADSAMRLLSYAMEETEPFYAPKLDP